MLIENIYYCQNYLYEGTFMKNSVDPQINFEISKSLEAKLIYYLNKISVFNSGMSDVWPEI